MIPLKMFWKLLIPEAAKIAKELFILYIFFFLFFSLFVFPKWQSQYSSIADTINYCLIVYLLLFLFGKELTTRVMVGYEQSTTSQTVGLHCGNTQKCWFTQLQELQASPESSLDLIWPIRLDLIHTMISVGTALDSQE